MHPPSRPLPQPPSTHQTDPQRSQQRPSYPRQYSTWSGRNSSPPESAVASELVWPLESLSLENSPNSSRRPTPAPRSPTLRTKKARMSDHEGDYFSSPRRTALDRDHQPSPSPATLARPLPTPRAMSYSKRHASFDGPREVPLPSPSATLPGRSRAQSPVSAFATLRHSQSRYPELPVFDLSPDEEMLPATLALSVPRAGTSSAMSMAGTPSRSASPLLLTPEDMEEFATLVDPLRPGSPKGKERAFDFTSPHASGGAMNMGPPPPYSPPAHGVYAPMPQRAGASYDRTSTASLPLPAQEPFYTLPSIVDARTPSSSRRERSTERLPSPPTSSSPLRQIHAFQHSHYARSPYAHPNSTSRIDDMITRSATDWRSSIPQAPPTSSYVAPMQDRRDRRQDNRPPEPPRVLTPPPPPEPGRTPHEAFLCQNPPPPETWIAVETTAVKYVLLVNLPGVERECITISARRRRVLHLVADGWENGGGHFERRIKFGYDADLAGVSAEFDGDRLRVTVPRRPTIPGNRSLRD